MVTGIDISIFKSHSVQEADCSGAGVTTEQVLEFFHSNLDGEDKIKVGISFSASQGVSNHTC